MKKVLLSVAMVLTAAALVYAGGDAKDEHKKKAEAPARPTADAIKKLQTIAVTVKIEDKKVKLTWSPANADPSGGIKIVKSVDQAEPIYPVDGYVLWVEGTDKTSAEIPLAKVAEPDKSVNLRLCSVDKSDHSKLVAVSNVVKIDAAPEVQAEKDAEKAAHEKAKAEKKAAHEKAKAEKHEGKAVEPKK